MKDPYTCNTWNSEENGGSPSCFEYQYKTGDRADVNMTLGVIMANKPTSGAGYGYQLDEWGDLIICNWYAREEGQNEYRTDPLTGIHPMGLHHNSYYSISCEKLTVPDADLAEGRANFEIRSEICGGAQTPDNTNIPIKDHEDKSDEVYYFGCSIRTHQKFVNKMTNTLTTVKMPNIKGAKIAFHHLCGNTDADAEPCKLKLMEMKQNGQTSELFTLEDDKTYNDGDIVNVTSWDWENFNLPPINADSRLQFVSEFDRSQGVTNLANIRIYSQQK